MWARKLTGFGGESVVSGAGGPANGATPHASCSGLAAAWLRCPGEGSCLTEVMAVPAPHARTPRREPEAGEPFATALAPVDR